MNPIRHSAYAFRVCLYLLFLFSGCSALVYQIVWTRQCMLLLGTTAYAVGTVLGIFFLGMGLGSFWGGRLAERTSNPMRLYGVIEILIGIWALVVIELISNKWGLVITFIRLMPDNVFSYFLLRIAVALFWFTLPALGMGMTFPLLSKYEQSDVATTDRHISILYLMNTLGATSGTLFAGFFLIPRTGYSITAFTAVGLNIVVGIGALAAANFGKIIPNLKREHLQNKEEKGNGRDLAVSHYAIFLGVFISGLVCLALEVLWTRLLIMIFLGTNYAYTAVLTSVLAGIAVGALLMSFLFRKLSFRLGILGVGYSITGVGILLTLFFISKLPEWMKVFNLETTTNFYYGIFGKFLLSFLTLILPMLGFGFTFPYALTLLGKLKRKYVYSSIGLAYGLNTVGSIIGSVLGGFVLIPAIGCEKGILVSGVLLIIAGFFFSIVDKGYCWKFISLFCLLLTALFFRIGTTEKINHYYLPEKHNIVFFAEGVESTVAVSIPEKISADDERVLWINRVQATTAVERGVRMNRFQGVIPWMFNRKPQDVLFMCFGSGITCGTLGIGDFENVDAVEISPEVLDASLLFADKNFNVLEMEKVHVHIDDARNFLIRSDKKYDFITTEPMPLALTGVSMFYTKEFYQFCLQHLAQGGMISQWVPFHSSHETIVQSAVKTFLQVFPYSIGLFVNADLFLVGSNTPLLLDPVGLTEKLEQNSILKKAMIQSGFKDVSEILSCFVMNREGLKQFSIQGKNISDTFPWVEFEAPQYVYNRKSVPISLQEMKRCFTIIDENVITQNCPEEIKQSIIRRQFSHQKDIDGLILYYDGLLIGEDVRRSFIHSLDIDNNNIQAQYYLRTISKTQIEQYLRWKETEKAKAIFTEVAPYLKNDSVWQRLAKEWNFD